MDFPQDLIDAQRAYYAAEAEVERVTNALPSSVDVVAGTATFTDKQRAELAAARAERLRLVDILYRHPFREGVDDQHAARLELQRQARAVEV